MVYVALLRGINVGGKSIVSMQLLREAFEKAGLQNVATYINSGNVIFETSKQSEDKLAASLEKIIRDTFGFAAMVLVLSGENITRLAQALPADWTNGTSMKCDVLFLHGDVDTPNIVQQMKPKDGIDRTQYQPGALFWSIDRKLATKSGLYKIVGTQLYKRMTVRNCNTLRKLAALVQQRS